MLGGLLSLTSRDGRLGSIGTDGLLGLGMGGSDSDDLLLGLGTGGEGRCRDVLGRGTDGFSSFSSFEAFAKAPI